MCHRKSTLLREISLALAVVGDTKDSKDSNNNNRDSRDARECRASALNLDGKCEYCMLNSATTCDHFYPLIVGSKPTRYCSDAWNCMPACKECNGSKGNRTWREWFASPSPRNPMNFLAADDKERLLRKFEAYDVLHAARCAVKQVDEAWWDGIVRRIDVFLADLQRDVVHAVVGTLVEDGEGKTQVLKIYCTHVVGQEDGQDGDDPKDPKDLEGPETSKSPEGPEGSEGSETSKSPEGPQKGTRAARSGRSGAKRE